MNERIRELREQAFDWVQYQLYTVGSDHPVMQAEQLEMINQKFAELIAEECAQICGSQADKKNIRRAFGLKVESDVKYPSPEPHWSIESQYNRQPNLPQAGEVK